jgi:hypothetical protein
MDIIAWACTGIPFYILDTELTKRNIQKPYYLLHVLHNILIMYLTYTDVINTYTDFHTLDTYRVNYNVPALVVSFHMYHIVKYYTSLRYDDWIHHISMIGLAIPLGLLVTDTTTFMSYSLFWTTGFPGAISYFSLFLERNDLIQRQTEKKINTWMNVWVRSPGCISVFILTLVYFSSLERETTIYDILKLIPSGLVYWNGQYFMEQAVKDYNIRYRLV